MEFKALYIFFFEMHVQVKQAISSIPDSVWMSWPIAILPPRPTYCDPLQDIKLCFFNQTP